MFRKLRSQTGRLACQLAWVAWLIGATAQGQQSSLTLLFSGPSAPIHAGSRIDVWINALNVSGDTLVWKRPETLSCRISAPETTLDATLDLQPESGPVQVTIAPGAFARCRYRLDLPSDLSGRIVVELVGTQAGRLVLDVQPAVIATEKSGSGFVDRLKQAEPTGERRHFDPGRFFKEHFSGYEPFYFVAGPDSPNAKFQFSFKYEVLNKDGPLAQAVPALVPLHFAYTQTSLWDWNQASAPFLDSSYKPELLYAWERIAGGGPSNWWRLDLQPGVQHESNGKAGSDSRSLNIAYLRPTLTLGRPEHLQLTLQPRVWTYLGDMSDNSNLPDYRGYADLRAIVGWERGLQLSATGRMGDTAERGSLQLDLTYPMMSLLSGSFSVYLHAQYFIGYGESLLLYNERSSAFRIGFSLYR